MEVMNALLGLSNVTNILVYIVIIAVFIVGLVCCIAPVLDTRGRLRKAIRLIKQGVQLILQGGILRAQVLALLTKGLLLLVGGVRLGLKSRQLGFHLGEKRLIFGVFLLLLAQTALDGLQVDLHIGDLLHHRGLVEDGSCHHHAAQEQRSHQNGGECAGNGLLRGETASFIPTSDRFSSIVAYFPRKCKGRIK